MQTLERVLSRSAWTILSRGSEEGGGTRGEEPGGDGAAVMSPWARRRLQDEVVKSLAGIYGPRILR